MKVLVIVALFAFVAVQVCQSAPVPDDDKTDIAVDSKKDEPAAPVPAAADVAAQAEPAAAAVTEAKSESASSDTSAKPADASAPPAEEKKE